MKIEEYVEAAKMFDPDAFEGVTDARAAKIVAAVLHRISVQIDSTTEGKINVQGLGRFSVKQKVQKDDAEGDAKDAAASGEKPEPKRKVMFKGINQNRKEGRAGKEKGKDKKEKADKADKPAAARA